MIDAVAILTLMLVVGLVLWVAFMIQRNTCDNCTFKDDCDRNQHDNNYIPPCIQNRMDKIDEINHF